MNRKCVLRNYFVFLGGVFFRWRSADGNDYLCGQCQSQNEVEQAHSLPSSPGKFSPRGFGKPAEPEASWRSGLKTKGWVCCTN